MPACTQTHPGLLSRHLRATTLKALTFLLIATGSLVLSGCPEDPLGPDNRMALIAMGRCNAAQALRLTELAMERGDVRQIERAWMLKAAILRDGGDAAAAEALYPQIEAAWQTARKRPLKPERREHDINLLIEVAHSERLTNGLAADCASPGQPD